ncbi:actin maturation protease [Epargyreus clarus]|uniref:actin maturation protease n=1 Tax=Epargyreus clarus TaxID=520877 RepID=UPI003C2B4873
MCTLPPPPPPPPPPPQQLASINTVQDTYNDLNSIFTKDVCEWASHELALWGACTAREICLYEPPFRFNYTNFESILQVGPTCGLVALSMFLRGEVSPDKLLNISKLEGYSHNGEMLSCKNMLKLAEKAINLVELENVTCTLKRGGLYKMEIIQELLDGAVLLVPYDADCNHYPCEKHGHTAHWALVSGVIMVDDPGEDYASKKNNVYVLCRHGKSRFLSSWLLEDLDRSNRNLWEFSPKKKEDGLLYVIPEDGIGGENGLRDQFLLFKGF